MDQFILDQAGAEMREVINQLLNGLITISEFTHWMAKQNTLFDNPDCCAGLLCPFTGLRYPTIAETDEFMAEFAAIK